VKESLSTSPALSPDSCPDSCPDLYRDSKRCVLVFVKAPYPGQVKTRLGQSVGDRQAAQLYRCFTEDVLDTIESLEADCLICFAPAAEVGFLKAWLGDHRSYLAQSGIDLGERMAAAFRHSFRVGYKQVLIVGSDSPDLPRAYLTQAFDALQQEQAVIGPSEDGGYYTLGFTSSNFCPEVFGPLPWSTSQVYPQTLGILKNAGTSVHILPSWTDIDTLEDLRQYFLRHQAQDINQIQTSRSLASRSLAYLQDHAKNLRI
jgi:uncharacterized protein